MIKYKVDVLAKLKEAGYTTYRLRKDKLLGEATMQKIRNDELVSWENMNTICNILDCDISDILIHEKDN